MGFSLYVTLSLEGFLVKQYDLVLNLFYFKRKNRASYILPKHIGKTYNAKNGSYKINNPSTRYRIGADISLCDFDSETIINS